MKAVVFRGPHEVSLVERPVPDPGAGEVLVRVRACGVCGTDVHIAAGEAPAKPPVILGHEFSGEVAGVGRNVEGFGPGDRVVVDPNLTCGQCPACRTGRVHLCRDLQALGVTRDGGFAEYCTVPAAQAHRFGPGLDFASAALAEPLACCLHGTDLSGVRPGSTALILGAGPIGLLHLQLARLAGASRVAVSEPVAAKRRLAAELGAEVVLDPAQDDPVRACRDAFPDGFDVVVEAAGRGETVRLALDLVAPGGTVLLFGVCPPGLEIPFRPFEIYRRELRIQGAYVDPFSFSRALALLEAGRIATGSLLQPRLSLAELPPRLGQDLQAKALKAVVEL